MCEFSGRYGAPGPSFARLSDLYTPVIRLLWPTMVEATADGPVSPELLTGLCWERSGFEPDALGPDGGEGLFSMRRGEARALAPELGTTAPNLRNPETAIHLAGRRMVYLMGLFQNNITWALLAFRLGVAVVQQEGDALLEVPELAQYVRDVLATMAWLCEARPWLRRSSSGAAATGTHAWRALSRRLGVPEALPSRPDADGVAQPRMKRLAREATRELPDGEVGQ